MNDLPINMNSQESDLPTISSFVLRFIHFQKSVQPNLSSVPENELGETEIKYRGTIRHVQSNREILFTDWKQAVTFIQNYVPMLEDE